MLQKPDFRQIIVINFFQTTTKLTFAARGKFMLINLTLRLSELCKPAME